MCGKTHSLEGLGTLEQCPQTPLFPPPAPSAVACLTFSERGPPSFLSSSFPSSCKLKGT